MGRRQWGLLGKHQLMICKIFLLGLAGLALAGEPGVFDNYFDDTIKEVDISLDIAIKGCLQNGDTFADKVRKAYGDCLGSTDYGFGDLAANEGGKDSDNDGLPDKFEGNEKCFYKKIGWVDGAGNLSPDAIKGDLAGLGTGEKAEFDDNIDKCASWNGDFSSRRKREVGENETEEEVSNVPSVMETGSSALSWLKAAVRKVRSAEPAKNGNNGQGGKRKGKKGKKKGSKAKKTNNKRKTRKGGQKKNGKKGKGKEKNRKKPKKGDNARKRNKKTKSGRKRRKKKKKKKKKGKGKNKNKSKKGKGNQKRKKNRKSGRNNKKTTKRNNKQGKGKGKKGKGKNKNNGGKRKNQKNRNNKN